VFPVAPSYGIEERFMKSMRLLIERGWRMFDLSRLGGVTVA